MPLHEGLPRAVPIPSLHPTHPTNHATCSAKRKSTRANSPPGASKAEALSRFTIRQRLRHLKLESPGDEEKVGNHHVQVLPVLRVRWKTVQRLRDAPLYTTYVILPVVSATGWVSSPQSMLGRVSAFRVPSPIHGGIPMSHYDQTPSPSHNGKTKLRPCPWKLKNLRSRGQLDCQQKRCTIIES